MRIITVLIALLLSFSSVSGKEVQKKNNPVKLTTVLKNAKKLAFDLGSLSSKFVSWAVDPKNHKSAINLVEAWKNFEKKKDIVVAVIDTGIDPHHPFLKDNLYTPTSKHSTVSNYGVDFSKGKTSSQQPKDLHGHGTHVSAIIKSVLPNVKILSLKYYDPKASNMDNLKSSIAALKYAVDMGVDIINYSGGGPEPAMEELRILKRAEKKGILIVAAAGNEESNIDDKSKAYYPASYGLKNIITVTAHDKDVKILSSSNWGAKSVDLSAPGHRIRSAFPNGRAGYLTGTSQATAFVTGVAAMIKSQHPELVFDEVKEIIKSSVHKEKSLKGKCSSGGRLNAGRAIRLASKYVEAKSKTSRALATKAAQ